MVPFSRVRQQAIRNLLSATLVLLAVTTVLGTRTIPVTIAIDVIVALTAHVATSTSSTNLPNNSTNPDRQLKANKLALLRILSS